MGSAVYTCAGVGGVWGGCGGCGDGALGFWQNGVGGCPEEDEEAGRVDILGRSGGAGSLLSRVGHGSSHLSVGRHRDYLACTQSTVTEVLMRF